MKIGVLALALLMVSSVRGQSDRKAYSREAAEKSFRALVAAKDSDIIEVIKNEGLVCFADSLPFDSPDRFLTLVLSKPIPTSWLQETRSGEDEKSGSIYDGKSDGPAFSVTSLSLREWQNQDWAFIADSGLEGKWHSYGHYQILKNGKRVWKAFNDTPPVFRWGQDKDEMTGATNLGATEDDTTFYASKKYGNRNNGTTTYQMNVRLSTGRYKETWTPDKGEPFESVGNCYKAKAFIPTSTAKKIR